MSDKIYCGNGKERRFDGGGSVVNITLDVDVLAKAFNEFGWTTDAGKRKIKIKLGQNRDGQDQYGNTHFCQIDTWKPDPNRAHGQTNNHGNYSSQPAMNPQGPPSSSFEDDIPF